MDCPIDVGSLLVVQLVAIVRGMVVGGMDKAASLMAPEKHD